MFKDDTQINDVSLEEKDIDSLITDIDSEIQNINRKTNDIDPELKAVVKEELIRQQRHVELIASENYVSLPVLRLAGSILTNKYAEGYPGRRYYGGCEFVDKSENLAIERLKALFNAEHANVQPHSGSQANAAAYQAILKPNDIVLAMSLDAGGHLTHGHKLNFSGIVYQFHGYGVDEKTQQLDYEAIRQQALELKPKLIVAGASAYSRTIDFTKFREIADEVGALLMVDMAHIAGLIAAGLHPNPVVVADIVTTTTHKTLRGPRSGAILCKKELAKAIDRAVFPGQQGGPLEHIIAAKAQAFYEAATPEFKAYQQQIMANCKVLENIFRKHDVKLISGGTDNHLMIIDVKTSFNRTGQECENILHQIDVICNKNMIPFDKEKPMTTSGIRIGTAAMTTRGWKEKEFEQLANIIISVLKENGNTEENVAKHKHQIGILLKDFPIYENYQL
ncbi:MULTISPECIES: serine hydroxymethyltransferase [unclassified Spiroplasma]|uniref:serine hydroxymethyltransferase n=1 Tax=unclassified Spiroplasma TaxID=2637901 RepID=UPI00313AAE93